MHIVSNNGSDPVRNFVQTDPMNNSITSYRVLGKLSISNRFFPFHFHGGVYSFAIWMKIPTEWEDQCKLPQFQEY